MGRYKLSGDAKEDLKRIYRYGVLTFGEAQANRYYDALFERFALYPSADSIRPGYRRSVCGVDNIFYRLSEDETVEIIAILGRQDYPERL